MHRFLSAVAFACLAAGASANAAQPTFDWDTQTALDEYVNKPDANYAWTDTGLRWNGTNNDPLNKKTWTAYVLNMTSQQWLTEADSNRPIWWHIMVVVVPEKIRFPGHAAMWITGGNNEDEGGTGLPSETGEDIIVASELAMGVGVVVVSLFQIPNQHIIFNEDPLHSRRSEDAIIAFTWNHYQFDTSNPEWLLRLPMTKAAVRAMDATIDFCAQQKIDTIEKFTVAGASKRGWTTWTVAAVDTRVELMVPIVMDELNFIQNIHHHYRAYGGWSFALEDYYKENFTLYLDTPETQEMANIVDPIAYAPRLTMPKLVCNSGGDEFFLPDDTHWWWKNMPGPKNFLMIPNAEHSEATGILELLPAIGGWAETHLTNNIVPPFDWILDNSTGKTAGDITMTTQTKPKLVNMWHSVTCNGDRRDFRLINADSPCKCGIAIGGDCLNLKVLWSATELTPVVNAGTYTYTAHRDPIADRWTAFFIDVTFDNPTSQESSSYRMGADGKMVHHLAGQPKQRGAYGWPVDWGNGLEFTTEVSIVPNTFPFPDCHGADCKGTLV